MKIDIPQFNNIRVLVVGDVMLDRYWHGNASRISPEAPVPVVHIKDLENRAGGAANVALNIKSLGGQVTLLGLVGDDEPAECLKGLLAEKAIDEQLLSISSLPTISKLRIIGHNQQLIRLDFEEGFKNIDFAEFLATYKANLNAVDVVIFSDYGKGTLHHSRELIELARAKKIPVLVDPKCKDFNVYYGATVITPNMQEFEAVVGKCTTCEMIVAGGQRLIDQYAFDAVLITRGAEGMSLICKNQEPLHIPTRAREVYDVTGAGDTVIATLATTLAAGSDLSNAVRLANAAAGVVVRKLGVATVSSAELRRAMQRQQDPWAAILTQEQLLKQVAEAREHNERIVMTNGCFDILHAGHVAYLEQAKAYGHRLVVAVNDDASISRLKGPTRPINNLEQRMLVLAALRAVDWVVPFATDTPAELIKQVKPDVLVKGGDYKVTEIAGADFVLQNGGEVQIIPFLEGYSTTSVINNIKNISEE